MATIKRKSYTDNPELQAPKFNFSKYEVGATYCNNQDVIDFVTDEKSLYVCVLPTITASKTNPAEQEGLLKLVSQGPQGPQGRKGDDGTSGVTPRIDASFDDDQLRIKINGETRALSPSLTGRTWKPVLEDNILTWELTDDRYMPESIDLETLRPIQKSPLLLRTNSDNTKRSDESSGPANFIQWKYEGDEHWTNLISISELMNLALAGVSIWKATDGKWHFGHREVVRANYISDKNGRKIISNVRLGDVLFDAGELPFAEQEGSYDYGADIDLIYAKLAELENAIGNASSLDDYATKNWVSTNYQPKGNYVTSVNGVAPQPGSNGAITISVGNLGSFDIRLKSDGKTLEKTLDGTNWVSIVDLSQFGGSGQGCDKCWSQEEIVLLIENVLQGRIPTDYVSTSDLDVYMRRTEVAATYATMSWVSDEIARALSGGQYEPEYHRIFTLYKRTNDRLTPPDPPLANVWEWNMTEGDILTSDSFKSGWDNHPQNATTALPYLWMATATFSSVTHKEVKPSNADSAWTLVCLTGESGGNGYNGTDGADGSGIEFIFTLIRDVNDIRNLITPVAPSNTQDDSYPSGWEDHPQGIGYYTPSQVTTTLSNLGNSEILFGIEMASMRKKASGSNTIWDAYSAPFIWSMWGEDGMDGDGVEYIFFVADENTVQVVTDQTTGKSTIKLPESYYYLPNTPNFIPTEQSQVNALGSAYQAADWVSVANNGWTDNPSDVDSQQPFEFVAIRKYHDGTGWGPFCKPKLWSHFGGITINPVTTTYVSESSTILYTPYKAFAFYRANETDNTLETDLSQYDVVYDFSAFGTQSLPNPVYSDLTPEQKAEYYEHPEAYTKTVKNNQTLQIIWHDTVPEGDGQLWLITNHISDETQSSDTGWTTPCRWGDDVGFNVEYCSDEELGGLIYTNPSLINDHNLTLNDYTGSDEEREAAWEQDMEDAGYGIWSDTVEDPVYMASTVRVDGVWSDWTVARIKGEKGNQGVPGSDGEDGNGVEFVFFALTPEQYNNRSNFIGNTNRFYVYDNIEHDNKTFVNNEYLPYAIISNVTEGRLWATDNNPGITEERPYVFVSTRHQVNGRWSQFHNIPGTGVMSSFGPASLWLSGDVIDYTYAGVNFDEDSIPVLVNSANKPVNKDVKVTDNVVDFYHGNTKLIYKSAEVKVNDTWVPFITVSRSSSGTVMFTVSAVDVNLGQNIILQNRGTIATDSGIQTLGVGLKFNDSTVINSTIEVPIRLTSFESYINELGNQTFYTGEAKFQFIPTTTEVTLSLYAQGFIKKSQEDSSDYTTGSANTVMLFRESTNNDYSIDVCFNGVSSFPTAYANWNIKVFFDDVQNIQTINIGDIYNTWRTTYWNDRDGESTNFDSTDDKCEVNFDPSGTVRTNASTSPIRINICKTFTKDTHNDYHYVHDSISLVIVSSLLASSLNNDIKFKLYDGQTLVDEEIIPIFYNGKDGTTFEIENTPVASAVVTPNGITFEDEDEEEIAELSIEHLNDFEGAIDENLLTDISNMTQVDSSTYLVGMKDIQSVSLSGGGDMKYINIVNNDGNLNISLNYGQLVADLRNTLFGGKEPIVQTIQVNNGTDTAPAEYTNHGDILVDQSLTIHAQGIQSVTSDGNDTFTVDTTNNIATINNVTDGFTVNTSDGSTHFGVDDNTNNGPAAPSMKSAARVIVGGENIYPGMTDDDGYKLIRMSLTGNHNGSTVTCVLHLSKPLYISAIDGDNADELENDYGTSSYAYLFEGKHDVIQISDEITPEILLCFKDIKPNTLISAYMTAEVDDGEDITTYRSSTVYFRTTEWEEDV